jgi:hypothetical protein
MHSSYSKDISPCYEDSDPDHDFQWTEKSLLKEKISV